MAIKKITMRPEGVGDYADELYPKTTASQVVEETNKKFMTDAERTKLAGIETGATADQTASEILTLIKTVDGAGRPCWRVGTGVSTWGAWQGLSDGGIASGISGELTMNGILYPQNNTSYTTGQARRIILSTADPSGGGNGDVWIKYTP